MRKLTINYKNGTREIIKDIVGINHCYFDKNRRECIRVYLGNDKYRNIIKKDCTNLLFQ